MDDEGKRGPYRGGVSVVALLAAALRESKEAPESPCLGDGILVRLLPVHQCGDHPVPVVDDCHLLAGAGWQAATAVAGTLADRAVLSFGNIPADPAQNSQRRATQLPVRRRLAQPRKGSATVFSDSNNRTDSDSSLR